MYIGRFAPSPTGPLHFGSLLAALASYLDARASKNSQWLLRIENTDPPREVPESSHQILQTLDAFGFEWDGPVVWQSQHHDAYQTALDFLIHADLAYYCSCSRKTIIQRTGTSVYDGFCRNKNINTSPAAVRFKAPPQTLPTWQDRIQGVIDAQACDDFILKRKDNLWAYQLAVVVDDAAVGVTHVVRGSDLLHETPKQMMLQQALGYTTPSYAHIPIATTATGQKLSKQNLATALNTQYASTLLIDALVFLNQMVDPDLLSAPPQIILNWAIEHWDITKVPKLLAHPYNET